MSVPVPDPLDPDYGLWCELNACTKCDGLGEDYLEDEWNESTMDYGAKWVCPRCGGTGIDPDAVDQSDYEQW